MEFPPILTILCGFIMNDAESSPPGHWSRSRYGFATFWLCSLLLAWFILRLTFFFAFAPSGLPFSQVLSAVLHGFHRDASAWAS